MLVVLQSIAILAIWYFIDKQISKIAAKKRAKAQAILDERSRQNKLQTEIINQFRRDCIMNRFHTPMVSEPELRKIYRAEVHRRIREAGMEPNEWLLSLYPQLDGRYL